MDSGCILFSFMACRQPLRCFLSYLQPLQNFPFCLTWVQSSYLNFPLLTINVGPHLLQILYLVLFFFCFLRHLSLLLQFYFMQVFLVYSISYLTFSFFYAIYVQLVILVSSNVYIFFLFLFLFYFRVHTLSVRECFAVKVPVVTNGSLQMLIQPL